MRDSRGMNTPLDTPFEIAHLELMSFEDGNNVPDWVHLVPAGVLRTNDGRGPYVTLQASELIANSFADTKKLPIDENHSIDKAGKSGFESRARGWIVEMEERPDGIWGRVEWTKSGRALLEDQAYAGFSPALELARDKKLVTAVRRASLTNSPNLKGLVTLHSEGQIDMDILKTLAGVLGLGETATEADVTSAVKSLKGSASLHSQVAGALSLQSEAGEAEILAEIEKLKGETGGNVSLQSQMDAIGKVFGLEAGAAPAAILAKAKAINLKADLANDLQARISELQETNGALSTHSARAASEAYIDAEIAKGRLISKDKREEYISLHMESPETAVSLIEGIMVFDKAPVTPTASPKGNASLSLMSEQSTALRLLGVSKDDFQKTLEAERQA